MSSLDDLLGLEAEPAPAPERGKGRPAAGNYLTVDGKRVPSVTTITSRFKDSGGLIYWAKKTWHEAGLSNIPFEQAGDDAATVGTIVHRCVEATLHGQELPEVPAELEDRVFSAFEAWKDWMDTTRLRVEATELRLVSEEFRYGGTIDSVLRDVKGRLAIGDWKSSNALYADYLLQVAAYGQLWDETQPEKITGGFHLVRFSKEHGDMEHRYFPNLDDALEMFLLLREAYEMDKALAKRIK